MVREILPSELWKKIEPVIAELDPGARTGRLRVPDRDVLRGILFVLKTGIQWEFLPQEMGCGNGMTCWRRLKRWHELGVWDRIHRVLLEDRQGAGKRDWSRTSMDASSLPAKWGARRRGRIQSIEVVLRASTT
jgi:transposase